MHFTNNFIRLKKKRGITTKHYFLSIFHKNRKIINFHFADTNFLNIKIGKLNFQVEILFENLENEFDIFFFIRLNFQIDT